MSIKDLREKIKAPEILKNPYFPSISDNVFYGALIVLVAIASFGLGRLSKLEGVKEPMRIENASVATEPRMASLDTPRARSAQGASVIFSTEKAAVTESQLVGSKNGTKYHYSWCAGASQISEQNKIYFSSKADAESKGYRPASNCKGL